MWVEAQGHDDMDIFVNIQKLGSFGQKEFFDFGILTEEKFREKGNYIHFNPVKWGLAAKAEDYKFSSALTYKKEYGEVFYI